METTIQDPNAPGALMLPPGEIERWVRDFHDERARSGGWPTIYVRKRDASNIALLLADEEETVSGFDAVGLGAAPRGHQGGDRGARLARVSAVVGSRRTRRRRHPQVTK